MLVVILIIFDCSYLVRALWDRYGVIKITSGLGICISQIMCGAVFDLMPLSLILYFHAKNFLLIQRKPSSSQVTAMRAAYRARINTLMTQEDSNSSLWIG